jgi:hypothetical protein
MEFSFKLMLWVWLAEGRMSICFRFKNFKLFWLPMFGGLAEWFGQYGRSTFNCRMLIGFNTI